MWNFSICSSFGGELSQKRVWVGSEPYVQTLITESPFLF